MIATDNWIATDESVIWRGMAMACFASICLHRGLVEHRPLPCRRIVEKIPGSRDARIASSENLVPGEQRA
jgi:hypothetical protein